MTIRNKVRNHRVTKQTDQPNFQYPNNVDILDIDYLCAISLLDIHIDMDERSIRFYLCNRVRKSVLEGRNAANILVCSLIFTLAGT